jgi:hypothetical protein
MVGMAANHEPRADATWPTGRWPELNRRLRLAFLAGAEERSVREEGRGLTEAELKAVLRRYPGDLPKS